MCRPKGEQSRALLHRLPRHRRLPRRRSGRRLAKPIRIIAILLIAWIAVRVTRLFTARLVKHLSGGVDGVDAGSVVRRHGAHAPGAAGATRWRRSVRSCAASSPSSSGRSRSSLVLEALGINLAPLLAGQGSPWGPPSASARSCSCVIFGLFMLMEDQYGVGDVIDTGVATGTVEGVLRTTRLRHAHGVVWHVPNGAIVRVGKKSQQWSWWWSTRRLCSRPTPAPPLR